MVLKRGTIFSDVPTGASVADGIYGLEGSDRIYACGGRDLIADFQLGIGLIDLSATGAMNATDLALTGILINRVLSTKIDYGSGIMKHYGVDQVALHASGFNDFNFA